jgi:hypothetical protein
MPKDTSMPGWLPVLLLSSLYSPASTQENPAAIAARAWRQQHERAPIDEFFTLLSIPDIASDKQLKGASIYVPCEWTT